jgi:hypothetical protein
MAAAKPKKSDTKKTKVFDISKPGTSVPDSSGKPIIVTNRPVLKDPMVVEENAAEMPKAETSSQAPSTTRIKITPLHEELSDNVTVTNEEPVVAEPLEVTTTEPSIPMADDKAKAAEQADTPLEEKPKPTEVTKDAESLSELTPEKSTPEPETKSEAKAQEEQLSQDKSSSESDEGQEAEPTEASGSELLAGDQPALSKAEQAALEQEAKHQQEIDKLIESKKYFLPLNAERKRKTKRHLVLGILLILVLAVAWADIALDAGMIEIPGTTSCCRNNGRAVTNSSRCWQRQNQDTYTPNRIFDCYPQSHSL